MNMVKSEKREKMSDSRIVLKRPTRVSEVNQVQIFIHLKILTV